MAFKDDIRLPVDVERGASGGPAFNTTVLPLSSGYEKRNKNWQKQRGKWNIAYGETYKSLIVGIIDTFYVVNGSGDGFRFKDWSDFQIGNTFTGDTSTKQFIGLGNHSTVDYQVYKTYTRGSTSFNRTINKLTSDSLRVFLDSTEKTITTDYTVDLNTGIITFNSAPGGSYATKDFTVSSITSLDTQTVTIDGHVYTFKTALTGGGTTADEVLIGATPTTAALHLYEAINKGANGGTDYGSSTVAHTTVNATNPSAGVVRVTAKVIGTAGNSIAISETCTNGAWAGGATNLSGGTDLQTIYVMCEFDVPVRFTTDDLGITTDVFSSEAVISVPSIDIMEIRV